MIPKNVPSDTTVIVRARVVLPISRPPIENGAFVLAGKRIVSVGRWPEFSSLRGLEVIDLGESILLPGLVNAHCHLDYTSMAGELAPQRNFVDWIQLITTSKSGWIYSDFAESWIKGAKMLLRTGTTTVGDIEMVPELLPEVWTTTPLRVISFLEMTGVKSRRPPASILKDALDVIATVPSGRGRMGLSPHAPYSTTPELLRLSAQAGRRHRLPIATHVAESDQEFEMFMNGGGKLFNWLERNDRDMSDCGGGSPVQHLHRQGLLGKNLLAIHVNYLAHQDAAMLAKKHVNVVHCPRSHTYFKHRRFPFAKLAAAGVNICLGTDSLASLHVPRKQPMTLSMFDEMREFAAINPEQSADTILKMATLRGAAALGLGGQVGRLAPKSFADFIAIPYAGKFSAATEAVVHHRGNVDASMIDGKWAIAPTNAVDRSDPNRDGK